MQEPLKAKVTNAWGTPAASGAAALRLGPLKLGMQSLSCLAADSLAHAQLLGLLMPISLPSRIDALPDMGCFMQESLKAKVTDVWGTPAASGAAALQLASLKLGGQSVLSNVAASWSSGEFSLDLGSASKAAGVAE